MVVYMRDRLKTKGDMDKASSQGQKPTRLTWVNGKTTKWMEMVFYTSKMESTTKEP